MSEYKLIKEIIALSANNNWDHAKLEWKLDEVYEVEKPETCLCGHFPIIEVCVLINDVNGEKTLVGNSCVKKFIGLSSDRIFQAIKRVRKDNTKSLNVEAINYAHEKKWINNWEKEFYSDIMGKRKLTTKQLDKKIQINEKLSNNMKK